MFSKCYRHRRVLVTGHTGFKGSWLAFWLQSIGAEVCGIALPAEEQPNHFSLLDMKFRSETCDIRNADALQKLVCDFQPEVVFHLAAQSLVRRSYRKPLETFETNVLGTANLLEACRQCEAVRSIVVISSDKCYENREWIWGYRENDAMGGYDPYSASKGCSELLVNSWRRSFFHPEEYGRKHQVLLASARCGNVIGGGDWAEDRLVPDLMKAAAARQTVGIRNPQAVRPWQHVLEPLSGYMQLGQLLHNGQREFAEAWNFGPSGQDSIRVDEMVRALAATWPEISFRILPQADAPHEAGLLRLDCSKANGRMQWHSTWSVKETIQRTANWYHQFYRKNELYSAIDLADYCRAAAEQDLIWNK